MFTFRLADQIAFTVSNRKVVVVVNDDSGERQAFYQSSGRNGYTAEGEWAPFHGWRIAFGTFWFIKTGEGQKRATPGSWEAAACEWLQTAEIPEPTREHDWKPFRDGDFGTKMRILRSVEAMNEWLDFHGVPDRSWAPRLGGAELAHLRSDIKAMARARQKWAA